MPEITNGRGGRRAAWVGVLMMGLILSAGGLCCVGYGSGTQTADALVKEATQTLKQGTPKRLKTRGKPKIVRWEDLDAALAKIPEQINYAGLVDRLRELLSKDTGFAPRAEILDELIDKTLAQQEVHYADLFALDDTELVPITNILLKYLPEDAWKDVAVYNKKGEALGSFAGKFPYEKSGNLTVRPRYRVYYFQYRDKNNLHQTATTDYIQRDEFCVKWGDIKDRPALTLATLKP